MNILMVCPEYPDTFWSYKHALRFIGKKSAFPPLGLLTVAAMLPDGWNKRLVDLNVGKLNNEDLQWADYVFISAMVVQKRSAEIVVERCHAAGVKVVGGGPLFTMEPDSFESIEHLILNEAEITLPRFLNDLMENRAERIYATDEFAAMEETPEPEWGLIDMNSYHGMEIQYSRGCPFNCEFCNVTALLGKRVRTKSSDQVIKELDGLYVAGWQRGSIFFVDDNFIGNKQRLKRDLLPRLIEWRKDKKGIVFQTEASINLADSPELMTMMVDAGFDTVFIGIETPDDDSLAECSKTQNKNRDLVHDVKKIQRFGLQVQGGFIVGFDSDKPSVFHRQIKFIQQSGIVTAMVGLLQAPAGTKLYQRMKKAGRLRGSFSGDNVDGATNIVPLMDSDRLLEGYHYILQHIYDPKHYYQRIKTLLREYRLPQERLRPTRTEILAFVRSIFRLGILGRERLQYWKLLLWTSIRKPGHFPLAVQLAIAGFHFRKVCKLHVHA